MASNTRRFTFHVSNQLISLASRESGSIYGMNGDIWNRVSNQLISLASRENLIEPLSSILRFVVFPIN